MIQISMNIMFRCDRCGVEGSSSAEGKESGPVAFYSAAVRSTGHLCATCLSEANAFFAPLVTPGAKIVVTQKATESDPKRRKPGPKPGSKRKKKGTVTATLPEDTTPESVGSAPVAQAPADSTQTDAAPAKSTDDVDSSFDLGKNAETKANGSDGAKSDRTTTIKENLSPEATPLRVGAGSAS